MKLSLLGGAAMAAALLLSTPASAQRTPSMHLRCDGLPDNVSAGETAARLIGAVTLLGLFAPPQEGADSSARLNGAEGVAICEQALAGESNDIRRAQLILAKAIHHIEAGQFDEAIVQARAAETDRPAFSATRPYQLSLRLAAMEIEAMALVGLGRVPEARAKALEMAAAAPYDVLTTLRAARYVRMGAEYGPAEQLFFETGMRLYPQLILDRAASRQMAGDFRGSAEDVEQWLAMGETLKQERQATFIVYAALTRAAAGDAERAEAHAAEARRMIEAAPDAPVSIAASELLDLYRIWQTARGGQAANARVLFANRTTWTRFPPAIVAAVARQLREGAPAAELTGALEGDPNRFRTEALDRFKAQVTDGKDRFATIRPFSAQAQYDRFGANVWREGRSRYLDRATDAAAQDRQLNVGRDGWGIPAGYAVLLHAALAAKAAGQNRFMLMPGRTQIFSSSVRFGNAGDAHLVPQLAFDADQVVRDLSGLIPRPVRR